MKSRWQPSATIVLDPVEPDGVRSQAPLRLVQPDLSRSLQLPSTQGMKLHARILWIGLVWLSICEIATSAPDDVEAVAIQNPPNGRFVMDDNNLENQVFQPHGNAKQARAGLEKRLKLQIDELHRICELTDSQKQKLRLAASNDIRRFFNEFEALRKKYKSGKQDQQAWQNIWQEIQPLQTKMSSGLFGDNSFFAKSTRSVMTAEQLAKYEIAVRERRRLRYRASVEVVMETLENSVPLRDEQHDAIVKLLIEETKPPLAFGQHDQMVVAYNLAKIPEEKLKPVLDERQWRLMQVQINQGRGWEHWLIQQGLIAKDEAEIKKLKSRVKRQAVRRDVADSPADATEPANKKEE